MDAPRGGLPVGRFLFGCVFLLIASWAFNRTFGKHPAPPAPTPTRHATTRPAPTVKPSPRPRKKVAKPAAKPAKKPAAKQPKRTTIVHGPAAWLGPGFGFTVPARWTMKPLPALGKWPKAIRRWELSLPLQGGRAKIDVEMDKTEDYARKGALLETRAVAAATAENFGFGGYQNVELTVKRAPGFYESWTAQVPGGAPFKVVAAHFLRGGVHYRLGAVAPVGDDAPIAEQALRGILSSWTWK